MLLPSELSQHIKQNNRPLHPYTHTKKKKRYSLDNYVEDLISCYQVLWYASSVVVFIQ